MNDVEETSSRRVNGSIIIRPRIVSRSLVRDESDAASSHHILCSVVLSLVLHTYT